MESSIGKLYASYSDSEPKHRLEKDPCKYAYPSVGSFSDPFASRTAPRWPERQDTQDMPSYVITPDRLEYIRGQKMYPFFDRGGNDGNGDFQVSCKFYSKSIAGSIRLAGDTRRNMGH